jgi:hypothetical protein
MWLKTCDEFVMNDLSVVTAGIEANTLADYDLWFRERDQGDSRIARTIPLSIPAKIN